MPLRPRASWAEAKAFAERLAAAMAADAPDRFVATMTRRVREGRIFVDYLRNGRGATAVAAYSTRARPGAPVSVPATWEELPLLSGGAHFRTGDAASRVARWPELAWAGFDEAARILPRALRR